MSKEDRRDAVRALNDEGLTASEIAQSLSVSRDTVYRDLKRLGLKKNSVSDGKQKRNDEIVGLYNEGLNQSDIATRFDLTQAMIGRILEESGVEMRGTGRGRGKTSEDEIKNLVLNEGLTQTEASQRLGVSKSYVSQVLAKDGLNYRSRGGENAE